MKSSARDAAERLLARFAAVAALTMIGVLVFYAR